MIECQVPNCSGNYSDTILYYFDMMLNKKVSPENYAKLEYQDRKHLVHVTSRLCSVCKDDYDLRLQSFIRNNLKPSL